jgi:tyrosine phenol-lyase
MFFPSTRAHQELAGARFVDVIIKEAHEPSSTHPFKGNVDLTLLANVIAEVGAQNIPYVTIGATVNMAGGQPISLENLRAVSDLAHKHHIRVILDTARAVENAYFIQQREPGYADKTLAGILLELCSLTDGCTMSGKKDALANIGGWLALNDEAIFEEIRGLVVLFEGLHTYGGMAGRDMEAMARGIEESVQQAHMRARIEQVSYLGACLQDIGVPVVRPIGGHAVYLDARNFYPHLSQEELPAQRLTAEIYREGGVRSVERGIVSAGRNPSTGKNYAPALELVRLAIPRRVYTRSHLDVVVESVARAYQARESIRGLKMVYEPKFLRFFLGRFEPLESA